MAAKVLTKAAAEEAKIALVDGDKGSQAVHETVVAMRAARRSGSANTKTKAEVNASGAKPWRQKGTGRARAGYRSSPIWRGGGVVFGPKPRDYSKKISKSVRRLAFQKALSERINAGDVLTVGEFAVKEVKTKSFIALLKKQTDARRVLIVSDAFDENTYRSSRNVKPVQLTIASDVNTEQLLKFEKILVTDGALAQLAARTNAPHLNPLPQGEGGASTAGEAKRVGLKKGTAKGRARSSAKSAARKAHSAAEANEK
jgi:large subunit ribosomal protein L4